MTRKLIALGLIALAIGFGTMLAPNLIPIPAPSFLLLILGVLPLLQAIRVIQSRRHTQLDISFTGDPEIPTPVEIPGTDLNDILSWFTPGSRYLAPRERLYEAAVIILRRYRGLTETEAKEQLARGTWTDDPWAATFLGEDTVDGPSLQEQIKSIIKRENVYHRSMAQSVDELNRIAGITPPSTDQTVSLQERLTQLLSLNNQSSPRKRDMSRLLPLKGDRLRETGHWTGVSVVALVGLGLGIIYQRPAVVLLGAIGIGYAAYTRTATEPTVTITADRTVTETSPNPDDSVEVTLTIQNTGTNTLYDLRVIDGVPDSLGVTDGSPRLGTILRPDQETSLSYTVTARRGVHSFGPVHVIARDISSTYEHESVIQVQTTLTCTPILEPLAVSFPVLEPVAGYPGQIETSTGGSGLEFHSTRAYRPGDPIRRIDWNRRARTGELTTLEFRVEQATTILLVIDATVPAYTSPTGELPTAVDRSVDAAGKVYSTLLDMGNLVGVTVISEEDCWISPGAGEDHRRSVQSLLATHPAIAPYPTTTNFGENRWKARFDRRLHGRTQLVLFSPLTGRYAPQIAREFVAKGHGVTVVSPDATQTNTVSQRLAGVARNITISDLRQSHVQVVDWAWDDPLGVALALSSDRWSR